MRRMKLITQEIARKVPALYATENAENPVAVAKFFTPDSSWTWYMVEYDPEKRLAFGWCDDGQGGGELGYFSIAELETVRGKWGLPVERDRWFHATPVRDIKAGRVR